MLCAVHPSLAPSTHEPFIGPYIQGLSPAASVSSDESLAAAMPDGTPTQSNGLPILNSRPAAPSDIYLDFDGNGTQTPYSEDSDSANYNAAEQASIWECWRQVSEYFAIFDINVTTVFTSARSKAWILLSNSHSGVGYSFVNVFPNSKPESFNPSSDVRTRQSGLAHELG